MTELATSAFEEQKAVGGAQRAISFELDKLPDAYGDKRLIRQVFQNLLANAIKFTRNQSKAIIEVGHRRIAGEQVYFVSDNGVGITPENLPKIFEPFFTTKEIGRGTGLGLAVCYGILTEHGGTLDVQSTVGVGTTFTITLSAVKVNEEQTV